VGSRCTAHRCLKEGGGSVPGLAGTVVGVGHLIPQSSVSTCLLIFFSADAENASPTPFFRPFAAANSSSCTLVRQFEPSLVHRPLSLNLPRSVFFVRRRHGPKVGVTAVFHFEGSTDLFGRPLGLRGVPSFFSFTVGGGEASRGLLRCDLFSMG
jgi:hypothetical protein